MCGVCVCMREKERDGGVLRRQFHICTLGGSTGKWMRHHSAEHIAQKAVPSWHVLVCKKPEPQLSLASKMQKAVSQQTWKHHQGPLLCHPEHTVCALKPVCSWLALAARGHPFPPAPLGRSSNWLPPPPHSDWFLFACHRLGPELQR